MARLQANFSGERRSAHFSLQLTPSERAELERRAHTKGMLLAEFVRACCFVTEAPTSRRRTRDAAALAIVGELGRVGNNLNQLAKHANQTGQIAEEVALYEAIDALKAALGRIV